MIASVPERDNHVVYFLPILQPTLCVENVGYNNFKYIQPLLLTRRQGFFTVHFVLSGRGELNLGGNRYNVEKGDIFYCPPNEHFSYYPCSHDAWEYVWISLSGSYASSVMEQCGFDLSCAVRRGGLNDVVFKQLEQMVQLSSNSLSATNTAIALWFNIANQLTDGTAKVSNSNQLVARAISCIEQNYASTDFKIEHIGKMIFVSHSYLCRRFLSETGTTLIKYLVRHRIKVAKGMLSSTNLSVKSVAFGCGFGDYSHFCKVFLKEVGQNPLEYRLATTK